MDIVLGDADNASLFFFFLRFFFGSTSFLECNTILGFAVLSLWNSTDKAFFCSGFEFDDAPLMETSFFDSRSYLIFP